MNKRSAGILLHISSLPSKYGIGDLGPAAKEFADFLKDSSQSIWQVLPLNPSSSAQGYSPYSSSSSLAGNTLLISPEILKENGLLTQVNLDAIEDLLLDKDFTQVEAAKKRMLRKAYDNYLFTKNPALIKKFRAYCARENYWLKDFALYSVIKEIHHNEPWYEWPIEFKDRHHHTLVRFENDHHDEMEEIRFAQFLFQLQWHDLKTYCTRLKIHLLGDLPIYVGYDSVDVWSNRDLFSLDKSGNRLKVAGVPPDAFNDNGQLWGMPVFRWDVLKKRKYDWWICRLKKNLEWFNEVRLDHFRAFSSFWEVDAKMDNAIKGTWKKGPGQDFFITLQKELGGLPFVAEDLGEIDDAVYALRDQFELAGMNVLQFAFGEDMPKMNYIPHHQQPNSVVYTGTHDNNTTVGWFQSISELERKNLERYTGVKVNKKNVSDLLCRMAYGTVANRAILPMQDILGLGVEARMNMPSSTYDNWKWKMSASALTQDVRDKLSNWCQLFDRNP